MDLQIRGPIFVLCPANASSGGPELLHQFVDAARSSGRDARVLYYPFSKENKKPDKFSDYNAPQGYFEDVFNSEVIVPEVATKLIKKFPNAEVSIWWGSVDFYFGFARDSLILDALRYIRGILFRRLSLQQLRRFRHFTQSEYAKDFLYKNGIYAEMLTDYLNVSHFSRLTVERKMQVCYNPAKGINVTKALIKRNPRHRFVPIQGLTPEGVKRLLSSSMVYIDFGNHPGKDRMPREAAMAGCCVIVGSKGAAKFKDVSIPEKFKLDESSVEFNVQFSSLLDEIEHDFALASRDFDSYRSIIRNEKSIFIQQVTNYFGVRHEIL